MKKTFLLLMSICAVAVLTGCRVPHYVNNNSFGSPYPGAIYNHVTSTSYIGNKLDNNKNVEILGNAYGTATAADYFMIISAGNCGVVSAKEDALRKFPGADDILNMEVETRNISILGVFSTVTTIVHGKAIKYKK